MRACGALFIGGTASDDCPARDQGWAVGGFGGGNRRINRVLIMPVNGERVPAIRRKSCALVVLDRHVGRAIDTNTVVVEQYDQFVQLQISREGCGFVAYALHQTAIARDDISVVIDHVIAVPGGHHAFRQRHPDGVADTLAQRARRRFNACGVTIFRVPGGASAKLTEISDFIDIYIFIPGQVQ